MLQIHRLCTSRKSASAFPLIFLLPRECFPIKSSSPILLLKSPAMYKSAHAMYWDVR